MKRIRNFAVLSAFVALSGVAELSYAAHAPHHKGSWENEGGRHHRPLRATGEKGEGYEHAGRPSREDKRRRNTRRATRDHKHEG